MNLRILFKNITVTLGLLSLTATAQDTRPNILFIFADDHAYDTVHSHGNQRIETPNLDKLTQQGTHFTHAYNSGAWNGAVCLASRAMMMTGNQLWNAKKNVRKLNTLSEQKKLFPQLMEKAGYETYYSGKWHVNVSAPKIWQHTKNIRPGMPNQTETRYQRTLIEGEKDTWDPTDESKMGFWRGGKHWSEVLADDGAAFLEQAAKSDKPFMMMLSFNAPHDPRQAPASYQKKYSYKSIEVPKTFLPDYPDGALPRKLRDERLAPFPRTPYAVQVNRSEYYALISHMDTQIGKILAALEKTGKADNTIIIYTADHGLACGQHGFLGKQNQYDHSIRVPWVITGPNIPKGKKVRSPIYLQDAMATCLDIAKAEKPSYVEFDSVLPLIKSDKTVMKDIYGSYMDTQRSIIHNGYKLIIYPEAKKQHLFHLEKDPLELKDLAEDKQHQATIQQCKAELLKQMDSFGDTLDRKLLDL